MKTEIDNLVRGILYDIAHPCPAIPELAAVCRVLGLDGHFKAVGQRAILARWAEDITLRREDRAYAQLQLAALPRF